MRLLLVVLSVLIFAPGPAWSDVAPELLGGSPANCQKVRMCDAEDDNGPCQNGDDSDEVVQVLLGKLVEVKLYSTGSTDTGYSCLPYESTVGYHASNRQVLHSTPLTPSQQSLGLRGPIDKWWLECAGLSDGVVTIDAVVCTEVGR